MAHAVGWLEGLTQPVYWPWGMQVSIGDVLGFGTGLGCVWSTARVVCDTDAFATCICQERTDFAPEPLCVSRIA